MSFDKNKRYSIEQAGNILKEAKEQGLRNIVKNDPVVKDFKPTVTSEADREKYLCYCICLLEDVSPTIMSAIPQSIRMANGLSSKDLAKFVRYFLLAKMRNSEEWLSMKFGVDIKVIKKFGDLGMKAVQEAINKKKMFGTPILGGMN